MAFLRRLLGRLLPPVSRREALGIACRANAPLPSQCTIYDSRPSNPPSTARSRSPAGTSSSLGGMGWMAACSGAAASC